MASGHCGLRLVIETSRGRSLCDSSAVGPGDLHRRSHEAHLSRSRPRSSPRPLSPIPSRIFGRMTTRRPTSDPSPIRARTTRCSRSCGRISAPARGSLDVGAGEGYFSKMVGDRVQAELGQAPATVLAACDLFPEFFRYSGVAVRSDQRRRVAAIRRRVVRRRRAASR